MEDQGQDKTEQKSRKKWEEARNKGELPRSRELATFILFAVLLIYFHLSRMQWFDAIGVVMADLLQFDRYLNLNAESLPDFLLQPVLKTAFFLAPFFLIVLVVAITANMGQVGFQLASQKPKIDRNRLDPMKGLKRIVSLRSLIEGLKSMLKTGFFLYLAYLTIRDAMPLVVEQAALSLRHQLNFLMEVVLKLTLRVTILMAALAIFDFGYQW